MCEDCQNCTECDDIENTVLGVLIKRFFPIELQAVAIENIKNRIERAYLRGQLDKLAL